MRLKSEKIKHIKDVKNIFVLQNNNAETLLKKIDKTEKLSNKHVIDIPTKSGEFFFSYSMNSSIFVNAI